MVLVVKNLPANVGDADSIPRVRKIPWRRKRQPTPVFFPGESHAEEPGRLQSRGSQSQTQLKQLHTYAIMS